MDISISLVSTNEAYQLKQLFPSLLEAAGRVEAEILVVAHRCTDDTVEFCRRHSPLVSTCINDQPLSYGQNQNLNLPRARGRHFLIMNTDIVVDCPDLFVRLRDLLDQNADIGLASPRILNADGTVQGLNKRHPTVLDLFLRRFTPSPLTGLVQRRLDHYEMRDVGYDRSYDVPFLSGAFMYCRADLLKRLGGFDPRYNMYFDDVDLCRRIQRTHRTVYCADATITHVWKRLAHKNLRHTALFSLMAARYFWQWGVKLW